jgi:hypothetical protein
MPDKLDIPIEAEKYKGNRNTLFIGLWNCTNEEKEVTLKMRQYMDYDLVPADWPQRKQAFNQAFDEDFDPQSAAGTGLLKIAPADS